MMIQTDRYVVRSFSPNPLKTNADVSRVAKLAETCDLTILRYLACLPVHHRSAARIERALAAWSAPGSVA